MPGGTGPARGLAGQGQQGWQLSGGSAKQASHSALDKEAEAEWGYESCSDFAGPRAAGDRDLRVTKLRATPSGTAGWDCRQQTGKETLPPSYKARLQKPHRFRGAMGMLTPVTPVTGQI